VFGLGHLLFLKMHGVSNKDLIPFSSIGGEKTTLGYRVLLIIKLRSLFNCEPELYCINVIVKFCVKKYIKILKAFSFFG